MSRLLGSTIALVGVVLAWSGSLHVEPVRAAEAQPAAAPPQRLSPTDAAGTPSRALLDRYCVSCHNERLQTAGLMLDKVDLGQVRAHTEVLEKVVRKLRSGQMPPEGRPRPDAAAIDAYATVLEAALDRESAAAPNPGLVASRRMNRVEYVNAIQDLLALEVDGSRAAAERHGGLRV